MRNNWILAAAKHSARRFGRFEDLPLKVEDGCISINPTVE